MRTEFELEYDLLVVSVADSEDVLQFYEDGMDAFGMGDEASALNAHADEMVRYVTDRLGVRAGGQACEPTPVGGLGVTQREGVPYATLTLDQACDPASAHSSGARFLDAEEYVTGTVTLLEYDLDEHRRQRSARRHDPSFTRPSSRCSSTSGTSRAGRRAPAVRH